MQLKEFLNKLDLEWEKEEPEPLLYSKAQFEIGVYEYPACGKDLFMYSLLGLEYLCQDKCQQVEGEIGRRNRAEDLYNGSIFSK